MVRRQTRAQKRNRRQQNKSRRNNRRQNKSLRRKRQSRRKLRGGGYPYDRGYQLFNEIMEIERPEGSTGRDAVYEVIAQLRGYNGPTDWFPDYDASEMGIAAELLEQKFRIPASASTVVHSSRLR